PVHTYLPSFPTRRSSDLLVLRPIVQEEVLASGIVIPDTAKEKPNQGEVIAVGPGRKDENGKIIPMDINVGDRVLYAKYTGQEIKDRKSTRLNSSHVKISY